MCDIICLFVIERVSAMRKIIEINNLSKSFGEIKAVSDLSFYVEEGQLFAFLGVNGAGKSTTISILCGQLVRDFGSIIIVDMDIDTNVDKIKKELGVVFQDSVLDKALTVRDNLESRAALYGIFDNELQNKINELAQMLDFKDLLNKTVGKLSGGQRRRIDIARALLNDPKILILDEPTTGLDPQTRKTLWSVIEKLRKERNMTVFLTTHYMEEAADADYVVIIDAGKIAAKGTPIELKNTYSGDFISIYGVDKSVVEKLNKDIEEINGGFRFAVSNTAEATKMIIDNPHIFTDYEIVKGKMDDVFLAATGKKLTGGDI